MAVNLSAKNTDKKERSAPFEISAALLEELGERLVSKPEIALAELVKNAYDADSAICNLTLSENHILVEDKGHGMTESDFRGKWMVISTQAKGLERFSRLYRRSMAGSKGVGRFSARYLGNVVKLTTIADDKALSARTRLIATFNWKEITKSSSIAVISIPYTVEVVAKSVPTGTTLLISGLRKEAMQISPSTLKTDILRLTDPAAGLEKPPFKFSARTNNSEPADPGFSVTFEGLDEDSAREGEVTPTIEQDILDAYVGRVRLTVEEDGALNYKVYWKGHKTPLADKTIQLDQICKSFTADMLKPQNNQEKESRGLIKEVEQIQHLPVAIALHSPIFIDLRFFPKRKGTFTDLGVNGVVAQSWLKENASLAVVDNNFAMAAYADTGSDWLGIDASKAANQRSWQSIFTPVLYPMGPADKGDTQRNPMLALPRGAQLVGRIHIATRKRPPEREDESDDWLQPNMDRESLRSNGAFHLLWHISRFAAELLAHFDRKTRLEEEEKANERKEQEARTALSAAIKEIRTSTEIEPEYRQRVVEQLKGVEARFTETQQYERDARLSLELISMMGVMAGFMTHEFEKAMETLNLAATGLKKLALVDPKLKKIVDDILNHEQALANYLDYMRVFIDRARDPVPQSFKSNGQVSRAVKTLSPISDSHKVTMEIDIDPKLPGPHMPVAAYNGIVINLVSNALKALVPKVSGESRKVRLYATNDASNHILVCADTGIGIPAYLRARIWDPLFSTTKMNDDNPLGTGLGLGLSVVSQVVKKMGGKIELMDISPPGYVTAFKVTLPLGE